MAVYIPAERGGIQPSLTVLAVEGSTGRFRRSAEKLLSHGGIMHADGAEGGSGPEANERTRSHALAAADNNTAPDTHLDVFLHFCSDRGQVCEKQKVTCKDEENNEEKGIRKVSKKERGKPRNPNPSKPTNQTSTLGRESQTDRNP